MPNSAEDKTRGSLRTRENVCLSECGLLPQRSAAHGLEVGLRHRSSIHSVLDRLPRHAQLKGHVGQGKDGLGHFGSLQHFLILPLALDSVKVYGVKVSTGQEDTVSQVPAGMKTLETWRREAMADIDWVQKTRRGRCQAAIGERTPLDFIECGEKATHEVMSVRYCEFHMVEHEARRIHRLIVREEDGVWLTQPRLSTTSPVAVSA